MWSIAFSLAYNVLKAITQWQNGKKLSNEDFLSYIEAHQNRASLLGDIADDAEKALTEEPQEKQLELLGTTTGHCHRESGYYSELYKTLQILPKYSVTLKWYAIQANNNKEKYLKTSAFITEKTKVVIPWQVIAAIHGMEATFDFRKQCLNGEVWTKKTTIVPIGKGPWPSFEASCVDAFSARHWKNCDFTKIEDVLRCSENYNGTGYLKRCKASPYLWSFSQHGLGTGKFTSDGIYSSTAVSKQAGLACILKSLYFA